LSSTILAASKWRAALFTQSPGHIRRDVTFDDMAGGSGT
jgi:hypothetical protein